MIYLHKILPQIVSPLFLIFFFILLGAFLKSKKITLIGFLILFFFSLPIVSNKLIFYLEKDYSPQNLSTLNEANAIVVLSGMVKTIKTESGFNYEFNGAIDRILAGIELFKNNKAPLIILTRGKVPWQIGLPEGEYLKNFSIKHGVPRANILLTEKVQNTDQEAKSVRKILKSDNIKVILVTSAFHMPRAQKVFEATNIKVIPYAVDYKRSTNKITLMDFIPTAGSLAGTSKFTREMIGRLYYNLKY
tara:strand:+ start:229 stop:969 length:741 start_codon:yes stop_codon:yes gene_type:complete